jgi:hypothetical protein
LARLGRVFGKIDIAHSCAPVGRCGL